MGEILKLILSVYMITLIITMIGAFIKFVLDVWKWHDREEKTVITASQFEADLNEPEEVAEVNEISAPVDETKESEVKENDESSEHNTSTIFGTWSKS